MVSTGFLNKINSRVGISSDKENNNEIYCATLEFKGLQMIADNYISGILCLSVCTVVFFKLEKLSLIQQFVRWYFGILL